MIQKPTNIYVDNTELTTSPKTKLNKSVASVANSATLDDDFIPETVFENLPPFLKDACSLFNDKYERDVFLFGMLTVLGGCFHNLSALNDVDKKQVATNLLTFIVAPSGNGKGVLNYCRQIIKPICKSFAAYIKKFYSKEAGKLNFAANISSSGLVEVLNHNNGIGIIIESEIDTLINANKQDWGNYSDVLRNSFENESYSSYRKGDKLHCEIEKIKLALAISGTPNQFKGLMFSAENGLFSRGCYYVFENTNPTLKFFGRINTSIDLNKQLENLGKRANELYELHLAFDTINVVFSDKQLTSIQDALQKEYNDIISLEELRANIIRSFIIAQKMGAILTFLEQSENKSINDCMSCTDTALKTAIELTLTSLRHSYRAYEILPQKSNYNVSTGQQKLLALLPNEFSRADAVEKARELKVNPKTIDNYLKAYRKKELIEVVSHGKFKKIT